MVFAAVRREAKDSSFVIFRSSFAIEEAQFNLAVNGHGEVSLVGKAGGGLTAGITVTLRRRNA